MLTRSFFLSHLPCGHSEEAGACYDHAHSHNPYHSTVHSLVPFSLQINRTAIWCLREERRWGKEGYELVQYKTQ